MNRNGSMEKDYYKEPDPQINYLMYTLTPY